MTGIESHPLSWPFGWKREAKRRRSPFKNHSMIRALEEVYAQLGRMGVPDHNVIISSNVALRRDGLPYSNQRTPDDPGVAVYFRLPSQKHEEPRRVLACDRWDRPEHNLWAIAKHIEALRGQDRWGVGTLEQAFTGYAALPAKGETSRHPWWEVLTCGEQKPPETWEEARREYRLAAARCHPDTTDGSEEAWRELQVALEQARSYYRVGQVAP